MGSSTGEAKDLFLHIVGFIDSLIEVDEENIFLDEIAGLISTALDHELKQEHNDGDPYFNPHQWELRNTRVQALWGKFYEAAMNESIPAKDGELVIEIASGETGHFIGWPDFTVTRIRTQERF